MDALRASIAQKRKAMEASNGSGSQKTKFVKRGDLERAREEEYRKQEAERLKKENEKKKKKEEEEEALRKQREIKVQEKAVKDSPKEEEFEAFNISREEVIRRLRAKGQPIRLFAETDKACKIRLRALELIEQNDGQGQQNDHTRRIKEMEDSIRLDTLKQTGGIKEEKKPKNTKLQVTPIRLDDQKDRDALQLQIYAYLSHLLEEWEDDLDARPEDEKRSATGKKQTILQKQTAEYFRPLFRLLKRKSLEPSILAHVNKIAHHMQNRRYVKAEDSYLQLSIGNAPWPIGVTMVGIHERTARESISASKVAHVLNDEPTRKWIQSLKRLMTYAQEKYPPVHSNQRC